MKLINNPDRSQWAEILKRPVMNTENLFDTVRSVIDRVKEEGDRAVLDYEEILRSDFIIDTGVDINKLRKSVVNLLGELK